MFTDEECASILSDFPKFELSYEIMTHKKVFNHNIILAIPEGIKCFAWFTTFKNQNICALLEIGDNHRQIKSLKMIHTCFHAHLSYGTIFYGTHFHNQYFSIEDVYQYKGQWSKRADKFAVLKELFEMYLKQTAYFKYQIVFGAPLMATKIEDVLSQIATLPYKIKYIQYRVYNQILNYDPNQTSHQSHQTNTYHVSKPDFDTSKELVFKITPDIQNDIYNLFIYDNNSETKYTLHEIAYIPDYITSVMMNKLFRNIKENQNLDALEESDDEEEFEDERPDKFVYLNKEYKMVCKYNTKFNKWYPCRLAGKHDKVATLRDLQTTTTTTTTNIRTPYSQTNRAPYQQKIRPQQYPKTVRTQYSQNNILLV